jgi:hypothetical protein
MTQGVKDLIDAIASGDSLAINSAFEYEMANRISERLDDMRTEVAQNMFATESVQEELYLEDYSLEELEEFMMSEDFEQLDELSKTTLGSYVDKANVDMANKSHDLGGKKERSDEVDRYTNRLGMKGDKFAHGDIMKKAVDADQKSQTNLSSKINKRYFGIKNAVKRLTK